MRQIISLKSVWALLASMSIAISLGGFLGLALKGEIPHPCVAVVIGLFAFISFPYIAFWLMRTTTTEAVEKKEAK